jgi:hypothetical protein
MGHKQIPSEQFYVVGGGGGKAEGVDAFEICGCNQWCGSGSVRIGIIFQDPDP